MMEEKKIGGLDRYSVESDLRSLKDADKVRDDTKRIGAVKLLLKEEASALAKVADNVKSLGHGEGCQCAKCSMGSGAY
jgi:hypothetical protein